MKHMTTAVALALAAGCTTAPKHTPPDYQRAARQPLPLTPIGDIKLYGDDKKPQDIAAQPVAGTLWMCRNTGRTILVPYHWKPTDGDPCGPENRSQSTIRQ